MPIYSLRNDLYRNHGSIVIMESGGCDVTDALISNQGYYIRQIEYVGV